MGGFKKKRIMIQISLYGGHTITISILGHAVVLTLSLPNVAKGKCRPNFQISFSKIVRNK